MTQGLLIHDRLQHVDDKPKPESKLELDVTIDAIDERIFHRIAEANATDEYCSEIRQAISDQKKNFSSIHLAKFSMREGALYYRERLMGPRRNVYRDRSRSSRSTGLWPPGSTWVSTVPTSC